MMLRPLLLLLLIPSVALADAQAVPTFHSIGITWSGSGGNAQTRCTIRYRMAGSSTWKEGYPLWFDARPVGTGTRGERPANEYRGSLVQLTPGTTYEIELALEGTATTETLTATTWSESFPVGNRHPLPAMSSETLTITQSGTPSAYELYEPAAGSATIDAGSQRDFNIVVDASYVIIRGLTLRNARINAIDLGPNAHDVVVEENDISGFGRIGTDGWGSNSDAALYCNNHASVERIIFQRNRVHHPRSDSNNWEEPRPSRGGDPHPLGAQAVTFESCGGNHVFRYNTIFSDEDHYFQDGIGGGDNFSFDGFPHSDSDIYGNDIRNCWDDGIEAEGGNRNVRVWGNYIDHTLVKVAVAATSVGPIYVFRNVGNVTRRSDATEPATVDGEDRGPFLKSGSGDAAYRGGRIFFFHNTQLQPVDSRFEYALGSGNGIADSGGTLNGLVSRNNILHIHKTWWSSIDDGSASTTNDFDFDLFNGEINAAATAEQNGLSGIPAYDPANPPGFWALAPTSLGFDDGERLAGFNDGFTGMGPDMGADEAGTAPMQFGVDAYREVSPADAGPIPVEDAGAVDASMGPGSVDAAMPVAMGDAGSVDNPGVNPEQLPRLPDNGCGCLVSGEGPSILVALVLLGAWRMRRRGSACGIGRAR